MMGPKTSSCGFIIPGMVTLLTAFGCASGVPMGTPLSSTATPALIPMPTSTLIPTPLVPRDVSQYRFFDPSLAGAGSDIGLEVYSVEDVLQGGLYADARFSSTHIAFLGLGVDDSVRCHWRGDANTADVREGRLRFWLDLDDDDPLPPLEDLMEERAKGLDHSRVKQANKEASLLRFSELVRGGLSTIHVVLACYAEYAVSDYELGSGSLSPAKLTVVYDRLYNALSSYDEFKRLHTLGYYGTASLLNESAYEARANRLIEEAEKVIREAVEGRQSVVFLVPMGAHGSISVEAWQAVAQWDVVTAEDGTVNAVRYGAPPSDPEHTQTLAELKRRITAATTPSSSGASSTGDATPTPAPTRIPSVDGLTDYYKSIGAYDFIGPYITPTPGPGTPTPIPGTPEPFTPAQPPPVYAPAPASLSASAQGAYSVSLNWGAVSGVSGYHVQYRTPASEEWWRTSSDSVPGTTHTVAGLECAASYDFRVGAYGDGESFNERAGLWAEASAETAACPTVIGVTLSASPGVFVPSWTWVTLTPNVSMAPAEAEYETHVQALSNGVWREVAANRPYKVRISVNWTLTHRAGARPKGSTGEYVYSEPVSVTWAPPLPPTPTPTVAGAYVNGVTLTVNPGTSLPNGTWITHGVSATTDPPATAVETIVQVLTGSGKWNTLPPGWSGRVSNGSLTYRGGARIEGTSGEYVYSDLVTVTWGAP